MSYIHEDDLQLAKKALESGALGIPLELIPNEHYFPGSSDPWDIWESEKYLQNLPGCIANWNRCLAKARRIKKIEKNREQNSMYCNKSEYNLLRKKKIMLI